MKLLCVVGMQRGFVTPECRTILPNILHLIEHFYLQNHLVIFTKFHNTSDSPYCEFLGWQELQCPSDQALLSEFDNYAQRVFVKYGYSVWTEAIKKYVEVQKVTQLYFAGIDTDACIYESALQAFDKHIRPVVVEDACMSRAGQYDHFNALQLLKNRIGEGNVLSMSDIIAS